MISSTLREESERKLMEALGQAYKADTREDIRAARNALMDFERWNHIDKDGKTAVYVALIELDRKEVIIIDGLECIDKATKGKL